MFGLALLFVCVFLLSFWSPCLAGEGGWRWSLCLCLFVGCTRVDLCRFFSSSWGRGLAVWSPCLGGGGEELVFMLVVFVYWLYAPWSSSWGRGLSSWGRGLAAASACGSSWAFLFAFLQFVRPRDSFPHLCSKQYCFSLFSSPYILNLLNVTITPFESFLLSSIVF